MDGTRKNSALNSKNIKYLTISLKLHDNKSLQEIFMSWGIKFLKSRGKYNNQMIIFSSNELYKVTFQNPLERQKNENFPPDHDLYFRLCGIGMEYFPPFLQHYFHFHEWTTGEFLLIFFCFTIPEYTAVSYILCTILVRWLEF
jgi:hypothetical protein